MTRRSPQQQRKFSLVAPRDIAVVRNSLSFPPYFNFQVFKFRRLVVEKLVFRYEGFTLGL
jgi:hypothetical protein